MPSVVNVNDKKYLETDELKSVFAACNNIRDLSLCRLSFTHGLRCAEALSLTWNDVNFKDATIFIRRDKNGITRNHPLDGDELRMLRKLHNNNKGNLFLFESRKSEQLTTSSVRYLMKRIGNESGITDLHHHQFRHSCGYHMAMRNIPVLDIQQWLGHRNIENTMVYIQLAGKTLQAHRGWHNL